MTQSIPPNSQILWYFILYHISSWNCHWVICIEDVPDGAPACHMIRGDLSRPFLSDYRTLFTFMWADLTQRSLQVTAFIMKGKPSDTEVRQPVLEVQLYCVLTG